VNQPYAPGAPYGRAVLSPIEAWNKRARTFGIVIIVCAAAYLFLIVTRLAFRGMTVPLLRMYFAWLESLSPTVSLSKMLDPIEVFLDKMLIWEIATAVPFAACATWLIFIGRRVRRCERAALGAVRTWTLAAAACIVFSLGVQIFVTLPATTAYSAELMKAMPAPKGGHGAAPFDVHAMVSSMTSAATGMGIVLGTLIAAAFPVALYLWSKKLERETPA
jgi:hypothetical protein